jgi:hypothetical protein
MSTTLIKAILDDDDIDTTDVELLPPVWTGMHVGLRITEGFFAFRAMRG